MKWSFVELEALHRKLFCKHKRRPVFTSCNDEEEEPVTTTTSGGPPSPSTSPKVHAEFQCDECDDAFNLEIHLGRHKRKVHDDWRLMWKLS